jgi:hypothetical protein
MSHPMNCGLMIGAPRSGTTIIARVIGGHSRVKQVIEPYQTRREEKYETSDFSAFLADVGPVDAADSLMVKETFTRPENALLSLKLLASASAAGVRPLVLLVLRSPIESFLSQIEMTQTTWLEKRDFPYDPRSVWVYVRRNFIGMHRVLTQAQRYHRRVILYRRFVANPQLETRRVMAAFPYYFEPAQLELSVGTRNRGGDPSAWKATEVSGKVVVDRSAAVAKFATDFRQTKPGASLLKLHHAMNQWAGDPSAQDDFIWDELERLVRTELVRNEMYPY